MTSPVPPELLGDEARRFVILKREPHVWHVLDRRTELVDVIAFPLDEGTVAHARAAIAGEVYRRNVIVDLAEDKLRRRLERAGYRVPVRSPRLDVNL